MQGYKIWCTLKLVRIRQPCQPYNDTLPKFFPILMEAKLIYFETEVNDWIFFESIFIHNHTLCLVNAHVFKYTQYICFTFFFFTTHMVARSNDLVRRYNLPLGQMLSDVFHTNCKVVLNLTTDYFIYLIKIQMSWRMWPMLTLIPPRYLIANPAWGLWLRIPVICIFYGNYQIEYYDIFRGPCTPILWFVFPDRYFCHFMSCLTLFIRNIQDSVRLTTY
jgi:hypothetical protein